MCGTPLSSDPTIVRVPDAAPYIGTLREKPLHASLKRWYARPGDLIEHPVEGFFVDLVRGGLLIEIQTSGLSKMKRKLTTLLEFGHRVRVVHPIPVDRWIVRVNDDGTILSRRRSPKHGLPVDVFAELVGFPRLLVHPDLEIEVLMTVEEEYRRHEPTKAWRRKGWVVSERRLVEVLDSHVVSGAEDLRKLIPEGLSSPFTTADLATRLNRRLRTAQQMAYCLRNAGVIDIVGRTGNSIEYRVS